MVSRSSHFLRLETVCQSVPHTLCHSMPHTVWHSIAHTVWQIVARDSLPGWNEHTAPFFEVHPSMTPQVENMGNKFTNLKAGTGSSAPQSVALHCAVAGRMARIKSRCMSKMVKPAVVIWRVPSSLRVGSCQAGGRPSRQTTWRWFAEAPPAAKKPTVV